MVLILHVWVHDLWLALLWQVWHLILYQWVAIAGWQMIGNVVLVAISWLEFSCCEWYILDRCHLSSSIQGICINEIRWLRPGHSDAIWIVSFTRARICVLLPAQEFFVVQRIFCGKGRNWLVPSWIIYLFRIARQAPAIGRHRKRLFLLNRLGNWKAHTMVQYFSV